MVGRVTVLLPHPAVPPVLVLMDLPELRASLSQFLVGYLPQERARGWDTHAGQTQPSVTARTGTTRVGEISQSVEKPEAASPALPGGIPPSGNGLDGAGSLQEVAAVPRCAHSWGKVGG